MADTKDIKGVIVDVMASVSKLRDAYSHLIQLFTTINKKIFNI